MLTSSKAPETGATAKSVIRLSRLATMIGIALMILADSIGRRNAVAGLVSLGLGAALAVIGTITAKRAAQVQG